MFGFEDLWFYWLAKSDKPQVDADDAGTVSAKNADAFPRPAIVGVAFAH
jgi:hypothetical protein